MASYRRSVKDLPYAQNYYGQFSTEDTNVFLSYLSRLLLDRLSPEGWERAGHDLSNSLGDRDFSRLCLYDPDVLDLSASDQYLIYQVLAFFRKRKDIRLPNVDPKEVALRKFMEAEEACRLTNERFRAWSRGTFQWSPDVERVLHSAQRKISKLLYPREDTESPTLRTIRPRFGPGATTQTPKRNACLVEKLKHVPACTTNFSAPEEALSTILCGDKGEHEVADIDINVASVAFVDKNAKTKRAICTEPALNGMFQLGLGDIMADRLRGVGIDIRDQGPNQRAAKYGSISGASATLDMSSASDTVAWGLVEHLFPEDYISLFWRLRSSEAKVTGGWPFALEKVSSMGNGFTFPLETIVFWALAEAAVEIYQPRTARPVRVLVYGDDIVVPTAVAVPLMAILKELGFIPNLEKSFWEGTFRESCGHDYVLGTNVRPVFVTDSLKGGDFFRLHNFFVAKGDFTLAACCEERIHPLIRLRGPKGYGDGHLHCEVWIARPSGRKKGWSGFTFETWTQSIRVLKRELASGLITFKSQYPHNISWRPSAFARVVQVATYSAYLREEDPLVKGVHVYADKVMPDPSVGPSSPFTLPVVKDEEIGEDGPEVQAVRTKVYTFEPPMLKQ